MTDSVATALLQLLQAMITDPDQPHSDPGDDQQGHARLTLLTQVEVRQTAT
jgi:hypothetical protein